MFRINQQTLFGARRRVWGTIFQIFAWSLQSSAVSAKYVQCSRATKEVPGKFGLMGRISLLHLMGLMLGGSDTEVNNFLSFGTQLESEKLWRQSFAKDKKQTSCFMLREAGWIWSSVADRRLWKVLKRPSSNPLLQRDQVKKDRNHQSQTILILVLEKSLTHPSFIGTIETISAPSSPKQELLFGHEPYAGTPMQR